MLIDSEKLKPALYSETKISGLGGVTRPLACPLRIENQVLDLFFWC